MSPNFKKIIIVLGVILLLACSYMLYFDKTFLPNFPYKFYKIAENKETIVKKESEIKTLNSTIAKTTTDIKNQQSSLNDATMRNSNLEQTISGMNMPQGIDYESILIYVEQRSILNNVMITTLNLQKDGVQTSNDPAATSGNQTGTTPGQTSQNGTPANGQTSQSGTPTTGQTSQSGTPTTGGQTQDTGKGAATANNVTGTSKGTVTTPTNNGTAVTPNTNGNTNGQTGTPTQTGTPPQESNPNQQFGIQNKTIHVEVTGDYFNIESFIKDINVNVGKYNYITKVTFDRGNSLTKDWYETNKTKNLYKNTKDPKTDIDKNIKASIYIEFNYK